MGQDGLFRSRIFYGWYVLMAAVLVWTISHGLQLSFGVFLKPLSEKFQWSRSLTAGAFMIYMICRGVSSIVMGGLTDKHGPRVVVAIGGLLMGSGMLLGSIISNIWELYLFYGILVGVGMGVVTGPLSATVSRWFMARRGLVQGILVSGAGVSNLIISPVTGYLILGFGINKAYMLMGAGSLVLICLSALALRKEPADLGLVPYGADPQASAGHEGIEKGGRKRIGEDWETSQAVRSRSFWFLAAVNFIFGISLFTVMTNIVPYATDQGIPLATATYLLSIIGAGDILGIMVISLFAERMGTRWGLVLCLAVQGTALFWLTGASSFTLLCLIAGIFGSSYAGLALQLLLIPPEFFGLRSLGTILGLQLLIQILGSAVGSVLGNLIYDLTEPHSYGAAFVFGGCIYVVAVILALIMKRPSFSPEKGRLGSGVLS